MQNPGSDAGVFVWTCFAASRHSGARFGASPESINRLPCRSMDSGPMLRIAPE